MECEVGIADYLWGMNWMEDGGCGLGSSGEVEERRFMRSGETRLSLITERRDAVVGFVLMTEADD